MSDAKAGAAAVPAAEEKAGRLAPPLAGEVRRLDGPAGPLALYRAGPAQGRPLLLVHSVNAAGSAYEMKPIFDAFAARRPVAALDLPGFGLSDRSDRAYTPRLMTDAILAAAAELVRTQPEPVDACGLSLGCEFLARAAAEEPGRFRSLVLISPTGLDRRAPLRGPPGATRGMRWLHGALRTAGSGRGIFKLLTTPGSVRWFLQKTFGRPQIDEGLLAYDLETSHQPGAEHAVLHFVSGNLFSADATAVYESLSLPVYVLHGTRGDFTDYRFVPKWAAARPNVRAEALPTGALPQFELGEAFAERLESFFASR